MDFSRVCESAIKFMLFVIFLIFAGALCVGGCIGRITALAEVPK